VTWHVFNNQQARVGARLARSTTGREEIPLPASRARFLRVQLRSGEGRETRVFLRRRGAPGGAIPATDPSYEVVGVERRGRPDDP
jgi:hypothetical protein